ncbi:MAG: 6-phosphofructokinase [Ilumatobacteraceae bacterium]
MPKTIDNDIVGTDVTFGFHTAVQIAHRCDRSVAHDRREPRPGHGRRGHGPARRMDRDVRRSPAVPPTSSYPSVLDLDEVAHTILRRHE